MRALALTFLLVSATFAAGCCGCSGDGERAEASTELAHVKAILTGKDGQSMSVRDLEVRPRSDAPVQHRPDELLFMLSKDSHDHAVYRLEELTSLELEPRAEGERGPLYAAKVTLRSGKSLNLFLFEVNEFTGATLDERAPFSRSLRTLSKIDVLNDASKK